MGTTAGHHVQDAKKEVQLGCLPRHQMHRLFVAETFLNLERLRQGYQRQQEPQRVLQTEDEEQ